MPRKRTIINSDDVALIPPTMREKLGMEAVEHKSPEWNGGESGRITIGDDIGDGDWRDPREGRDFYEWLRNSGKDRAFPVFLDGRSVGVVRLDREPKDGEPRFFLFIGNSGVLYRAMGDRAAAGMKTGDYLFMADEQVKHYLAEEIARAGYESVLEQEPEKPIGPLIPPGVAAWEQRKIILDPDTAAHDKEKAKGKLREILTTPMEFKLPDGGSSPRGNIKPKDDDTIPEKKTPRRTGRKGAGKPRPGKLPEVSQRRR